MSGGYSNNETLSALRQAGVIRNCVVDFNEIQLRKANKANAIIKTVGQQSTFDIHNRAIVLRRKRDENSVYLRVGGSISDKDLVPILGPINGAGDASIGPKSIYDTYAFTGFSISNDVHLEEDNVQIADALAVQAHGVITVPHHGSTTIQMGNKVMWAVVESEEQAQDMHRKFIGRPRDSVFAHLEVYEPETDIDQLLREHTLSEQEFDSASEEQKRRHETVESFKEAVAAATIDGFKEAALHLADLRREKASRVVGIALNTAAPGDLLDLFIYPEQVFSA